MVKARLFAGGFSGVARNGVMKGALSDLGVELVRVAQPQSVTQECSVVAGASVEAASYAGGFAGAFSNSYSINDTISGPVAVRATTILKNRAMKLNLTLWRAGLQVLRRSAG